MSNDTNKRMAIVGDSLTDQFILKGIAEDGDANIGTTTVNDISHGDISALITAKSLQKMQLIIGYCSTV